MPFCVVFLWRLYNYERKWGTTTFHMLDHVIALLYNYERKWGTTTRAGAGLVTLRLYNYERKWGTTTNQMHTG